MHIHNNMKYNSKYFGWWYSYSNNNIEKYRTEQYGNFDTILTGQSKEANTNYIYPTVYNIACQSVICAKSVVCMLRSPQIPWVTGNNRNKR